MSGHYDAIAVGAGPGSSAGSFDTLIPRINSQNINPNSARVPGSSNTVSIEPFGMRKCTATDNNPPITSMKNKIPIHRNQQLIQDQGGKQIRQGHNDIV